MIESDCTLKSSPHDNGSGHMEGLGLTRMDGSRVTVATCLIIGLGKNQEYEIRWRKASPKKRRRTDAVSSKVMLPAHGLRRKHSLKYILPAGSIYMAQG